MPIRARNGSVFLVSRLATPLTSRNGPRTKRPPYLLIAVAGLSCVLFVGGWLNLASSSEELPSQKVQFDEADACSTITRRDQLIIKLVQGQKSPGTNLLQTDSLTFGGVQKDSYQFTCNSFVEEVAVFSSLKSGVWVVTKVSRAD